MKRGQASEGHLLSAKGRERVKLKHEKNNAIP
jgi:hypothetical protein